MEAVDLCLGRVMQAVEEAGGILVVTADHGNADDMYEHDKKTGAVVMDPRTGIRRPGPPLAEPGAVLHLRSGGTSRRSGLPRRGGDGAGPGSASAAWPPRASS